ncbi:MAG: 16S rRNA (guanine(527)-N(7))-methyltransferase RsmG [Oscillibacter sp.]
MEQLLQNGLTALGLPTAGIPQLLRYADTLLETNRVMNLTAITDPAEVATLHFLDSAALLSLVDFRGKTLADVGTGAGFPGLPLRILEPTIRLTLLDSLNKRVDFLQRICDDLGFSDVACVHSRAEEFAAKHRETFDLVSSRAVASLPLLLELCLPLVKVGGACLAMKSVDCDQELTAAKGAIALLGGQLSAVKDYQIPGTEIFHRLIVIEKIGETPKKYPRAFAKIKKNPL